MLIKKCRENKLACKFGRTAFAVLSFTLLMLNISCSKEDNPVASGNNKDWKCSIEDAEPECSPQIGCFDDFLALASESSDASVAGVSAKTVVDLEDKGGKEPLYFQNSKKYKVHYEFVSNNLSTTGIEPVRTLEQFNQVEYYRPDRRFILGAITYYEGPDVWTYEIAPYDQADVEMVEKAYEKIVSSAYFGDMLFFHPTSQTIEENIVKGLSKSVKVISSDVLYAGVDYQPLNYGTSYGRLVFVKAEDLDSAYVTFRDIVVLDKVPNDISVTCGIITEMFQTPLSHINVLSQNRGTPNMALKGVFTLDSLKALEGEWVKFEVSAAKFSVSKVDKEKADEWWDKNRPAEVGIPKFDLETKKLCDIKDMLDLKGKKPTDPGFAETLDEALDLALPAYGGKASHYGAFPHMDSKKLRYPGGFAIPVFYYWQFMEENGFNERVAGFLKDEKFQSDPATRDKALLQLRTDMMSAPVNEDFKAELVAKLRSEYSGIKMRFRSSTNAEDLDGFTGAGLYTSKSGDLSKGESDVLDAIREVWSSVWYFRAFEERSYRNIDHTQVGMALLVHRSFPDEEANGVAITANIYDPSGAEPAFYVNAQTEGYSVVLPDPTITSEQFLYYYAMGNQPITYLGYSSMIDQGKTVLTPKQVHELGVALEEIHSFFRPLYGADANKWYAMDTEFKFDQPVDDPAGEVVLYMKQARPYPGLGNSD